MYIHTDLGTKSKITTNVGLDGLDILGGQQPLALGYREEGNHMLHILLFEIGVVHRHGMVVRFSFFQPEITVSTRMNELEVVSSEARDRQTHRPTKPFYGRGIVAHEDVGHAYHFASGSALDSVVEKGWHDCEPTGVDIQLFRSQTRSPKHHDRFVLLERGRVGNPEDTQRHLLPHFPRDQQHEIGGPVFHLRVDGTSDGFHRSVLAESLQDEPVYPSGVRVVRDGSLRHTPESRRQNATVAGGRPNDLSIYDRSEWEDGRRRFRLYHRYIPEEAANASFAREIIRPCGKQEVLREDGVLHLQEVTLTR